MSTTKEQLYKDEPILPRTQMRHPSRFPEVRRRFNGDNKKELKSYLKGKHTYRDGFTGKGTQRQPAFYSVRFTKQELTTHKG